MQNSGFRVFLERLSASDAGALSRNANDYEIAYNAASFGAFPYPYMEEHALSFIDAANASMKSGIAYHFGIHMNDGTLIGAAGVISMDPSDKSCQIGYWIGREHWGRGYAREAVALLSSFCFRKLGVEMIYADVFGFNKRSISLLSRLGFEKEDAHTRLVAHYNGYAEEDRYKIRRESFDISQHAHGQQ